MEAVSYLTISACIIGLALEVYLNVKKRSEEPSQCMTGLSPLSIYLPVGVSAALAVWLKVAPATSMLGDIAMPGFGYFGCALIVFGLVVRWRAVTTLGRHFTVDGAIREDHEVIDKGLYAVIRHPSYLGALLTYLGFGLALENWLSLIVMFLFPTLAQLRRIFIEEKNLLDHFGSTYRDYMKRTKRLIPGIF